METETVQLPVSYFIGSAIAGIAGIGCLVCLIMTLIPLFKKEGPGLGILGIFCGIYTYIWGWMNAKAFNLKKILLAWTACMVVALIGYAIMFVGLAQIAASAPSPSGAGL